ncbi:HARBI1 [Mytilus coruscus]|uniref:Putative nuclease HARBI1 n=1 Tax=Mytilus coruscus TaxID=42192 RepID=A0A6J8D2Q9_MYTCO|nr:HARBI1 [Mytilus coruscus]
MDDMVIKTETLIDENEKVTSNINNDVLSDTRQSQSNILSNNLSGQAGNLATNMCDIVVKKEPIFDGNEKVEVNTDFDSQFEILGSVISFKDEKEDTIEVPQPLSNENICQSNLSSGQNPPSVEKGTMVVPPVQTKLMYENVMCPSNFSSGQKPSSVGKREMVVPPLQSKPIFEKIRKLLSTRALSVEDVSLPSNISENTLNSNAINSQPIDTGQDFVKSHSIEVTGTVSNKSLSTSDQSVLPHTSKPRPHIIKRFVRIKPVSIGKSDSSVNNEEIDKIDHDYSCQHGQSDIVISSVTAAPQNLQAVNLGDCNRSSDGFTCEKNKNERTKEIQEIHYTVNMVNSLQTKFIGKWEKKKEPHKCEVLGRKEVLSRSEKLRYTFRPITIMLPSNANKTGYDCKECNKTLVTYNYQRLPMYQCKECPFYSICKNAFMSHYKYSIFHHIPLNVEKKPGFPSIKEKKLEFTLGCRCRLFLTNSPIEMADHLASCEAGNQACLIMRDMNFVASFFKISVSEFTKKLNSMTPKELIVQRNITTDVQDVQTHERFDRQFKDQYCLNVAKRLERQISSKFSGVPISVSISPAAIGGKTRNFMNNHNTSKRIQNSELASIRSVQDDSEFLYVEKVSQVSETDSFMNHFPKVWSVATDTKTNTSLGFSMVTSQIAQKAAPKTFQTVAPRFTLVSSGVGQTSISPTYLKTAGNIALPLINKNQNKTADVTLSSSNTAPRAVVLLLPGKAGQKDVLFFPTVTTPTTTNDVAPVLTAPPKSGQNTTTSTIQNTASGNGLTSIYDVSTQKIIQWEPDKSEQTVLMLKKSNFTPNPSLRTSTAVTKLSSIVSTMGPSTKLVNLAPIVSKKYPPRLQNSGPTVYTVYPPTRPHDSASVVSTAFLSAETQSSTQYDGQNLIQTDILYSAQTDTWNLTPKVSTSSRVSVMVPFSEAQNLINTISWDTVPILTPVSEELVQETASTRSESLASTRSEITASRRSENTAITRSESIASTRSESTAITRSENTASARFESTASTRTESTVITRTESTAITWSESTASTRTESTASTRSESITSTRSESTASARSGSIASTRSESIASTRSIYKPFPLALFPNVAALQNKGNGLQQVESTHNNVSQSGVSQVSSSMNQMSTLKHILQSLHYRVQPSNSASNFAQNKNSPISITMVPSNTGESVSQRQKERTSKAKQQITGKNAAEVNRLDAFAAGDDGNNKKLKRKFNMQGFKLNEILCTRNKRRKEALEKCLKISREVLNDNSFSGSIHCTSNQVEADNTYVCAQDKTQTVHSAKDQMQTVVPAKDQMQTLVPAADRMQTVVSSNNQIQTLTPAKDQMRREVSAIDQMQALLAAHLISKGDYCEKTLTNMKEKELSQSHNTEVKVEPLDKEYFQTEICQPEVVIENVEGTDYYPLYNDNKGKSIPHTKCCSSSEEHVLVERRIKEEYVPMENSSVVFENIPRESIESEPLNINSGLFYSSETESCPSDNDFYPSDDDICQSVKAICPSVKDICPSVKDICPSDTITTADSSLSVRNFPFGRDCKEVGKSSTEVVKVSAERRMSWIKNQSLQWKDSVDVYKMQVPCSGETNAQLSDNRQQQSTQDIYVCNVKQEPLEETEKNGHQEPEPLKITVSTVDSGHQNENTFLKGSEKNTQQLDNEVQVKQESPLNTDECGQQMPEPLNMILSQVVQVKDEPSMETDEPVQQMPEPLNTNLSPVVQVKEEPSMETDEPVQQMPEPLNINLSPGAASVSTPGLNQLVITPVYELKDGKIQIKLCLKPQEKEVNLKENQQNNFVSVPLLPVPTTDKEGTESSSNKQGLQENSEKNYKDKKSQDRRRLPNILSSSMKVKKKKKGKGNKYNQYAKWCELTRKKSQNEDPEIGMESDDLDTSLIDSNIVHIGEIQHRKENRSLTDSDVDSEELQTMVEDTSLIALDVVDSEEIQHRKEDTSLIDSDVDVRQEDSSLVDSDVFDRSKDRSLLDADVVDRKEVQPGREDKSLTDSDNFYAKEVQNKTEDKSLMDSDIVDSEDVQHKREDRSLIDSDIVDSEDVQHQREDRSLIDSDIVDSEDVQHKKEDRSLIDSDIVDSEEIQLRTEDKSLIDSDIVDSEEVQHQREDRSLIDSDIVDSEEVQNKREVISLIDSDIVDTEEIQPTFCRKEDRKEKNRSCNDNTIATSNNELTGTEDNKIDSTESPNQAEGVEKTTPLKRSMRCRNKSWKITEIEKSKIEDGDFSEKQLRQRYRFGRETIDFLANELREDLKGSTNRKSNLTVERKVMIALCYYGSGSTLQGVGETMGFCQPVVSKVVNEVTNALIARKEQYVKWPTDEQKNVNKRCVYDKTGFPNVIGCIGGTHVPIHANIKEDEYVYMNRKGFHSLNVQVVCDHKGIITNVSPKWPGSYHNAHVFRDSAIRKHLEESNHGIEQGVLLGDSGYPCRPFLLTPYRQPADRMQQKFNGVLCSTRFMVERVIGNWKKRFQILGSQIRMQPTKACKIITACAILHNIAILRNEPDIDGEQKEDVQPRIPPYVGKEDGHEYRDHLAIKFFS